jgi:hypothetical protein
MVANKFIDDLQNFSVRETLITEQEATIRQLHATSPEVNDHPDCYCGFSQYLKSISVHAPLIAVLMMNKGKCSAES